MILFSIRVAKRRQHWNFIKSNVYYNSTKPVQPNLLSAGKLHFATCRAGGCLIAVHKGHKQAVLVNFQRCSTDNKPGNHRLLQRFMYAGYLQVSPNQLTEDDQYNQR